MQQKTFRECCEAVIAAAAFAAPTASIQYAASYAEAGRHMTDAESIRVQALYILSNLQGWRGTEAQETKGHLRGHAQMEKVKGARK